MSAALAVVPPVICHGVPCGPLVPGGLLPSPPLPTLPRSYPLLSPSSPAPLLPSPYPPPALTDPRLAPEDFRKHVYIIRHIFGLGTSLREQFILKRHIEGPDWLVLRSATKVAPKVSLLAIWRGCLKLAVLARPFPVTWHSIRIATTNLRWPAPRRSSLSAAAKEAGASTGAPMSPNPARRLPSACCRWPSRQWYSLRTARARLSPWPPS